MTWRCGVRPIWHYLEHRIETHIFVAFLAYCLQVTLKARLRTLAGGITPREVIDKFKTMQMVDVHLPTTDGRELILSRYTQPEPEHRMLIDRLHLRLPAARAAAAKDRQSASARLAIGGVVETFGLGPSQINNLDPAPGSS